jgi:hypothetical protein
MILGFGRKKQRWIARLLSFLMIEEEEVQESPKKLSYLQKMGLVKKFALLC